MSTEQNIETVKQFFAAIGGGGRDALLSLVAEDIEWIVPGKDWPLAGTHRAVGRGLVEDRPGEPPMRSSQPPSH